MKLSQKQIDGYGRDGFLVVADFAAALNRRANLLARPHLPLLPRSTPLRRKLTSRLGQIIWAYQLRPPTPSG